MKEAVINEIILEMQSKVDNGQLIELKSALERIFYKYESRKRLILKIQKYQMHHILNYFYRQKKLRDAL